ncbi:MAG: GIY-YIG nuclease family protein [Bacteroidales bacterium]|nr:GIY-YIG nuclease family protein [Bacteroidales bacterium]
MGKTITTYLLDGNPQGVQNIFISNKICSLTLIPRSSLDIINKRDELKSPAFYILLGEDEFQQPKAYLGETENFSERIKYHDYKKTFWQKALVFISKDGAMTKADVQYLEHMAVALAQVTKKYNTSENKQIPKAPNLPEHQKSSIEEFFDDVTLLTSFVGCSIFEKAELKGKHIFYTKARGCNAKGFYDESGFTVLKGSIITPTAVPSFTWLEKREREIQEFTELQISGLVLITNRTFNSPSTACDFCVGSSNNGWIAWKDEKGQTLDEIYRKKLEE